MTLLQPTRVSRRSPARRGFSLIEVMIAVAILLGSAVVLSRLAGLGRTYAQNTAELAEAQRICENTLTEILLGLRPLTPVESAPLLPPGPAEGLAANPDENLMEDLFEDQLDDQSDILRQSRPQDLLVGVNNTPRWLHSVRIGPADRTPGLISLTVEVFQLAQAGRRSTRYSLTRWLRQTPRLTPRDGLGDGAARLLGGLE